jgi:hypothetical protein
MTNHQEADGGELERRADADAIREAEIAQFRRDGLPDLGSSLAGLPPLDVDDDRNMRYSDGR